MERYTDAFVANTTSVAVKVKNLFLSVSSFTRTKQSRDDTHYLLIDHSFYVQAYSGH